VASDELRFKVENAVVRGTGAGMPLGVLGSNAKIVVGAEGGQSAGSIIFLNIQHMCERLWTGSLKFCSLAGPSGRCIAAREYVGRHRHGRRRDPSLRRQRSTLMGITGGC
jgi:hypothetical protein